MRIGHLQKGSECRKRPNPEIQPETFPVFASSHEHIFYLMRRRYSDGGISKRGKAGFGVSTRIATARGSIILSA